ncbi:hypothetical protein BLA29_006307 [Euroglyphus maynei]|uniref:Uncharacterized protein n=1 Tax=Euroglyphus maynei TaxID=6958 RepID=A0A1Y3B974_EURMA|nr:hypothetical protein BLA29_006307 [Euroglyphus maynei]
MPCRLHRFPAIDCYAESGIVIATVRQMGCGSA